ncbi:MAG: hypothetical protein PHS63_02705 [Desulfoplanes sp.]|nr:hypothetical protein [Desulfoplanes sp.]
MSDEDIRIFKDGDQWCALRGTDLQTGVSGFGSRPEIALADLMRNEQFGKEIYKRREEIDTVWKAVNTSCEGSPRLCNMGCPFTNGKGMCGKIATRVILLKYTSLSENDS